VTGGRLCPRFCRWKDIGFQCGRGRPRRGRRGKGLCGHTESVIGDGWRRSACCGAMSGTSGAEARRRPGGDDAEHAFFTGGAAKRIATSQAAEKDLPRFANGLWGWWRGVGQELPCSRDELAAASIGLKAVVSDTDETMRQHVEEETVDECACVQGHEAAGVAVASIVIEPPRESRRAVSVSQATEGRA
jgi:hypothetical protein